jgi:hypothetical protein
MVLVVGLLLLHQEADLGEQPEEADQEEADHRQEELSDQDDDEIY